MKIVKYCDNTLEANIIKTRLESEGIPACVINENAGSVLPYGTAIMSMLPQVAVSDDDYQQACELILGPTPVIVCPECSSDDIVLRFGGRRSKIVQGFLLILASLGCPVGNVTRNRYCRKCKCQF